MRLAVLLAILSLAPCAPARAAEGEASFTPLSFYVPLYGLALENSMTNASTALYHCAAAENADDDAGVLDPAEDAGTGDEWLMGNCLIDMADNSALEHLFGEAIAINPGTYDRIRVYTCGPGQSSYSTFVKGRVNFGGVDYYTSSHSSAVLTTMPGVYRHTRVEYAGCASDVPLPKPVTIAADDSIEISAFFSLRDIAWATITGNGPPGGCTFNHDHNQSVCTALPIPIAYLGAETPALERYFVTEDPSDLDAQKAGGQMLILRSGDGTAFGGWARRLYRTASHNPSVGYDTPIKSIKKLTDSAAYFIETWGGGSPSGAPLDYYIRFPAFELQTHNGSLLRGDTMQPLDYRAVRQPN